VIEPAGKMQRAKTPPPEPMKPARERRTLAEERRLQHRHGLKKEKVKEDDEGGGFASIVIGAVVVAALGAILYTFRRPLLRGFREKRSDKLPSAFDNLRGS
jgi:hypothetical protein